MYIFASQKSWNVNAFNELQTINKTKGVFVGTSAELKEALKTYGSAIRYVFFAHWSEIIPKEECSKMNGIIFHCTELPFGRGGSPLQNLIARGFTASKLSAIRLVEGIDEGNILTQVDFSLLGSAEEIFIRMNPLISKLCDRILKGEFEEREQSGTPTLFKRRKPAQSNIENAKGSLLGVHDFVRMLDAEGYPKAFLEFGPFKMEFSRSSLKQAGVNADVKITLIPIE
jgi:methionyl-tRNA formyltransferase